MYLFIYLAFSMPVWLLRLWINTLVYTPSLALFCQHSNIHSTFIFSHRIYGSSNHPIFQLFFGPPWRRTVFQVWLLQRTSFPPSLSTSAPHFIHIALAVLNHRLGQQQTARSYLFIFYFFNPGRRHGAPDSLLVYSRRTRWGMRLLIFVYAV